MGKQDRGFAHMDPETQRRIASQGGKAAQATGTAHRWTVEEARAAARKSADLRTRTAAPPAPVEDPGQS